MCYKYETLLTLHGMFDKYMGSVCMKRIVQCGKKGRAGGVAERGVCLMSLEDGLVRRHVAPSMPDYC